MKLGLNSVLFGGHVLESAFKWAKTCGYDAIEISAIGSMSEHLVLERWRELAPLIRELARAYEIPVQAMEQPSQEPGIMETAFQAAVEIGIPVVNCGPGGKSDDEGSMQQVIDSLGALAEKAERYGVTLCVKAHFGSAIYNTASSLRVLEAVTSPSFGLDMDPSHIYRAGENPVEALSAVIDKIRHVHIRDCPSRNEKGTPQMQTNGRGAVDLVGYIRVLHDHGYDGPVDLEIIGAKDYSLAQCIAVAAEARGHMQACLQACGAR